MGSGVRGYTFGWLTFTVLLTIAPTLPPAWWDLTPSDVVFLLPPAISGYEDWGKYGAMWAGQAMAVRSWGTPFPFQNRVVWDGLIPRTMGCSRLPVSEHQGWQPPHLPPPGYPRGSIFRFTITILWHLLYLSIHTHISSILLNHLKIVADVKTFHP